MDMYIKHYCEEVGKRVERPFLDHHVDLDRVWRVVADVSSKSNGGGRVEHPNLPQSKKINKYMRNNREDTATWTRALFSITAL